MKLKHKLLATGLVLASSMSAQAGLVEITATVESLVPTDSIAFAPLRVGFGNGSFDAFNLGDAATAPIISVAEGGSGADWFPAFAAADPGAVLGTVGGLLLPGTSASASFVVDTNSNQFLTFASMVVPSNDFFIGNDSPTQYQLFDGAGNLQISEIVLGASDIWDAGSEIFDPAAAAFLVGGTNGLRTAQGGVVNFNFAELEGFNGLETGVGYFFDSQLTAESEIYRISFETVPVPEPATASMLMAALGGLGLMSRRREVAAQQRG